MICISTTSLLLTHVFCMFCISLSWAASDPTHTQVNLGEESGPFEVECDYFRYFEVEFTEPCKDLRVQVIRSQGEPDLYVSRFPVVYPTDRSLAWSSYDWGHENLTISSWDPEFEVGTFYIGVHAYCATDVHTGDENSIFILLVESVPSIHPETEDIMGKTISGKLRAEGYDYYRFCIPRDCVTVSITLDNCLDASECPETYSWPELIVARSKDKPTINDHAWKLAQILHRTISLSPSDPNFRVGHYYVAVYGWCTPEDDCPDRSTCGPCDYTTGADYSVSVKMEDISPGHCSPVDVICEVVSATAFVDAFDVLVLFATLVGLAWVSL